jgi:hypothetical protein
LPDDGLQKKPKYAAVIIHIIKTLICSIGENRYISSLIIAEAPYFRVRGAGER